jgi:membrane protease YdiL (CAAX protease family)
MIEQDVVKPGFILGYILSLVALSWAVVILSAYGLIPLASLALVPFLPGILAFLFLSLEDHPIEVHARPLLQRVTAPSLGLAVAFPSILLGLAALVALGTGLGYPKPWAGTGLAAGLLAAVTAFIYAIPASLGQEYGYRGYLLPALTYWQGRNRATVSVGAVWGIAMAPVSYLLVSASGSGDPLSTALLGLLLTVAVAFAYSCCAYLSESILSVILMNILLVLAIPAIFPGSWNPSAPGPGGLIGVTWPSPLPLLLLVALAFVPVFLWFFTVMDGETGGDVL